MKLKPIAVGVALSTLSAGAVFASSSDAATLKEVNQEMAAMQSQMAALKSQVRSLRSKLQKQQQQEAVRHNTVVASQHTETSSSTHSKGKTYPTDSDGSFNDNYYHFGNSVVLAPSTGVPPHYDGSSFIISSPSVNENIDILERTKDEIEYYKKEMGKMPSLPRLVLSGDLLGIGQMSNSYQGKSNSDIDLTGADLVAQAVITPWVSGMMELSYDNSAAVESTRRIDNSRIYLNQGFMTIGNFSVSPFFATLGQFYAPFGRYSSIMISNPLTKYVGRTKARAFEFGFRPQGTNRPYAEAFIYRGAATTSSDTRINNGGVDFGFSGKVRDIQGNIGVSYVRNIADADGMQDTGAPTGQFEGFNQNSNSEHLEHVVPGGDIHANFGYKQLTLMGEYVSALRQFATEDMSYNGTGARPAAYHIETDYSFNMIGMPSTFGLSYGHTYQALGLNLPRDRYMAALQMAIRRYTLLTFEFRHDDNYSRNDTSTHDNNGTEQVAYNAADLGKSSNTVTAQLAIYF